jgi:hypothetical protein
MISPKSDQYMTFKFAGVGSCTYLRSVVNNENKTWTNIHSKTTSTNQPFLAYIILFRSKLWARNTKLKQYKTPNTTHTDHEQTTVLRIFERKTVKKIHGPAKE